MKPTNINGKKIAKKDSNLRPVIWGWPSFNFILDFETKLFLILFLTIQRLDFIKWINIC